MHPKIIASIAVAFALTHPVAAQAPAPLPLGSSVTIAPRAADQTLGAAVMSAIVSQDGTLQAGSGVVGAERTALGRYRISFNRNIDNCVAISNHFWLAAGITSVNYIAGGSALFVYTFDHNNADVDAGAKVIVFCSK